MELDLKQCPFCGTFNVIIHTGEINEWSLPEYKNELLEVAKEGLLDSMDETIKRFKLKEKDGSASWG